MFYKKLSNLQQDLLFLTILSTTKKELGQIADFTTTFFTIYGLNFYLVPQLLEIMYVTAYYIIFLNQTPLI